MLLSAGDICRVNIAGIASTDDGTITLFIQGFLIYNPSFIVIGTDTRTTKAWVTNCGLTWVARAANTFIMVVQK